MIRNHLPQKPGAMETARRLGALFLLVSALIGLLAASVGSDVQGGGQPLSVSLPAGPQAFFAFPLLEKQNSRYAVSMENRDDDILAALHAGTPDAALIPAERLPGIDKDTYAAAAVTSFGNLVAIQNGGTAKSVYDLNGRSAIMPCSLQDAVERKMLAELCAKTNVALEITFENDDSIANRAKTGGFDIMLLPAGQCAPVLLQHESYRACFDTAGQWMALLGTIPPAGDVLVIRADSKNQAATAKLLADIRTGIEYANAKHKKASQLISALGLGNDPVYVLKTLPHCAFAYLDGAGMNDSIRQLLALTANP